MKSHYLLFILHFSNLIIGQNIAIVNPAMDKYVNVRDFCISAQQDEVFFSVQSPNQELSQIVCVKNNKWNTPTLLPFCDNYSYLEPFLSHDGKRLYFASNRPTTESNTQKKDFDIWYVERKNKNSKWSKPINLGKPVNSDKDEFYPTLSDNNNLYFTMESDIGLGKDDIYFCKWNGTNYTDPILLDKNINSPAYEFNAFISKDESMLLFTKYNAKDGLGSGDLYISKKDQNGQWKPAENLGNKINSKYMEYCPFYDSKTNTLYFTSKRSSLLAKTFQNFNQYLEYISQNENGLSKIYKCKIKL